MGWDKILTLYPPLLSSRIQAVFRSFEENFPGRIFLKDLVDVLLPYEQHHQNPFLPQQLLPFGGFVQWLTDYFFNRWKSASDHLYVLLEALELASRTRYQIKPTPCADPWVQQAVLALLKEKRYFKVPKAKPRPVKDPAVLAGAQDAMQGITDSVMALNETTSDAEAEEAINALFSDRVYNQLVVDIEELLHAELPVHNYVRQYEDVLEVFKMELKGKLRIALTGEAAQHQSQPDAKHDKNRCHQDDYEYWLEVHAPLMWKEWQNCLLWVHGGEMDVLGREREETSHDGRVLSVYEALFFKSFDAGQIRATLTRVDEHPRDDDPTGTTQVGQWLLSGLQVAITPGYMPSDPLKTWHDTAPFQEVVTSVEAAPEEAPEAVE